ncbi:MAG: hypothetical protein LBM75_09340 [Myxococcales bacterium]|nr:hypothetical protein [Myxococcales bacterium]
MESVNEILAKSGVTLPTEVREDVETEFEECGAATGVAFRIRNDAIELFAEKLSVALFVLMKTVEQFEGGGSQLVEGKALAERLRPLWVELSKFQRGNPVHALAIKAILDALPATVQLRVIDVDELGKRGFDA